MDGQDSRAPPLPTNITTNTTFLSSPSVKPVSPTSSPSSTSPLPSISTALIRNSNSPVASPSNLISTYNLTSFNWSAPFPSQPNSSASNYLFDNWDLLNTKLYGGDESNLNFVQDPFPTTTGTKAGTVLAVDFPNGTFSQSGDMGYGGTTFYPSPFSSGDGGAGGEQYLTALMTYDVAFPSNFTFIKGGKLPGVFGDDGDSTEVSSCSGGTWDTGCFSVRVMWRSGGEGELYAYIPTYSSLCKMPNVTCNDNGYGTSINRGAFTFPLNSWTTLSLLVRLNDPPSSPNGLLELYVNDQLAISQAGLIIRTTPTLGITRMMFSTFFGGSEDSWAAKGDERAYFRNLKIWTSTKAGGPGYGDAIQPSGAVGTIRMRHRSTLWTFLILLSLFAGLR